MRQSRNAWGALWLMGRVLAVTGCGGSDDDDDGTGSGDGTVTETWASFCRGTSDGSFPFTSNCAIGEGVPYYAVFDDVGVFAEQELETKLCNLGEGSVLPAGSSGRGYSLAGSVGESTVYELILGPFSAECLGQDRGYISVPRTRSFGSTTWLVPVAGIIGPE